MLKLVKLLNMFKRRELLYFFMLKCWHEYLIKFRLELVPKQRTNINCSRSSLLFGTGNKIKYCTSRDML